MYQNTFKSINIKILIMPSNGLQKYVDEQANVADYHNDLRYLQAYNRGVAAALAAAELQATYAFPGPTRMPDGFARMRGGGSDGYSVGPGSVDNAEYASLVTGGMDGGLMAGGRKKINRLKKAKQWLSFTDEALGVGEKHASAAKEIAGAGLEGGKKKKINRVKKAKKWLGFVDSALGVGEKHAAAVQDIAGPMMMAAGVSGGKVNRVKKAKKWLNFVDDALSTGEKHASAAKSIAGGKVNRVKKAKKWLNFVDDALSTGEKHASAAKSIAGAGKPPKGPGPVAGPARKPSAWIAHVKSYAAEHGIPYKEAMSQAKASYKK